MPDFNNRGWGLEGEAANYRRKSMLYSSVAGEGEPLILLHGLFGMGDNLSMIARPLSDHFRVYSLDLRNHGRSPRADTMTFSAMADDVRAFMDAQQLSKARLLGHSLGGKVAMQLALEEPERVDRLVVADIAPVEYRGNHDQVFAGLNAVDLATLSSRRQAEPVLQQFIDEPQVRMFLLKNLYRNEQGVFAWRLNIAGLQQCYDDLRQANHSDTPFTGPTLFIKGEQSPYIREHHRAVIERLFPAAQLKIIQNAGHWLHVEKTAVFNRLVKNFLLAV
jgi:esterase